MARGYVSLVLHGHLPYVRHPEYDEFFEERWLFEAITECYIPLLQVCYRLLTDEVPFRFAISLSPTLCAMLKDDLLQRRYIRHLEKLIELTHKEVARTSADPKLNRLARFYRDWLTETLAIYHVRYGRDLLKVFKRYEAAGMLELFTTSATHGYLPLLKTHPRAVEAQVAVGVESFRRTFGKDPRGMWLPECAFYPGLENVLADNGIAWFLVDSHGILHGSSRPHYGLFAPIACDNGVAAFGRDPESSRQVWSAHEGYPGDFDYRDFYRDLGFDADFEYIRPYILDGKTRILTGIKYHRVTGRGDHKELYDPDAARRKAAIHAAHFIECRQKQTEWHAQRMDRPPLVVSPYDAELFGHWWFEGPQFIEFIARAAAAQTQVEFITPTDYLERHPILQRSTPSASSWGWQGYNECWLSGCNEWIYPELHRAARIMTELATRFQSDPPGSMRDRILNQAARSLLLAQASDWPFILKCNTAVDYANKRVKDHLARFHYLADAVRKNDIDPRKLAAIESLDNIFPFIDFRLYAETGQASAISTMSGATSSGASEASGATDAPDDALNVS